MLESIMEEDEGIELDADVEVDPEDIWLDFDLRFVPEDIWIH